MTKMGDLIGPGILQAALHRGMGNHCIWFDRTENASLAEMPLKTFCATSCLGRSFECKETLDDTFSTSIWYRGLPVGVFTYGHTISQSNSFERLKWPWQPTRKQRQAQVKTDQSTIQQKKWRMKNRTSSMLDFTDIHSCQILY